MKKVGIVLVFFVATLGQSNSFGAGPVEVLLIKQNGISLTLSLEVLEQINETLDNSDLFPSHIVIGANGLLGVPEVLITSCSDFDAGDAAECVRDEFESTRNLEDADVVIAVVASLNQCGSTLPGTVNRERIGNENQAYAYAVIRADCLEFPANGMRVASHEFGHILSLEHSDDESGKETTPISYNHAAEDFDDLTVMGNETGLLSGDCPATPCTINDFFSENGRQFPDGGDAGNSSYADAERVVSEISWDVVAAYRPKPPPQPASCGILFLGCHQPLCAIVGL